MSDIVERLEFEATHFRGIDGHREKDALLLEAAREIKRLRTPERVTGEAIERVAQAIEDVETSYSIRLTRLVDDEATYTLTRPGHGPMEFPSHEEALEYVVAIRNEGRAKAAIEAMQGWQPAAPSVSDEQPKAENPKGLSAEHASAVGKALCAEIAHNGAAETPESAPSKAEG